MNRRINIILLMLLVLAVSCTRESLSSSDNKPGTQVSLRFAAFNTRAIAGSEDAVSRVRIIIFGSESSSDKGQLLCNKLAIPNQDGLIKPVIITNGVRDIYLIVNEPQGKGGVALAEYTDIATVADIEALELAYVGTTSTSPYRPTDIPMFARHLDMNVHANNDNATNSKVERMMAKVTLNLNIKDGNFTPSTEYPVINTITIKNLPLLSYVATKPYVGTLTTSELQAATAVIPAATDFDHSYTNTFYVPEYILSAIDKGAYLEIKGYVNGDAAKKETKWTVKVGDAMDGAKQHGDRYDITRNRHYIFTGDVKSYGECDVKVTVLPWNSVDTGGDVGQDVVTINKTEVALYDNIINKSIFIERETGLDPLKVDATKLFSAITYPDGITEAQQGLKLGVERRDDKTLWITIKNSATDLYKGDEVAKFDIQFGSYKHTISVIFPNIVGFFGGAPDMGNLKGDGTMYSSLLAVSLVEQPWYGPYKVDYSENDFEINSNYYGKEMNIAAAALPNLAGYPAFNYCIGLNKDVNGNKIIDRDEMVWYLPSQNQLMTMYVFSAGLKLPSYVGDADVQGYCSSTQGVPPISLSFVSFVSLRDGYMYGSEKHFPYAARCVRDIMP